MDIRRVYTRRARRRPRVVVVIIVGLAILVVANGGWVVGEERFDLVRCRRFVVLARRGSDGEEKVGLLADRLDRRLVGGGMAKKKLGSIAVYLCLFFFQMLFLLERHLLFESSLLLLIFLWSFENRLEFWISVICKEPLTLCIT